MLRGMPGAGFPPGMR